MKLRFDVDQAEAFRRGIDCPKSIVTVEINPAKLSQTDRDLIADRMDGIDVCQLGDDGQKLYFQANGPDPYASKPARIVAKLPTFDALVEAIRENEKSIHRAKAKEAK